MNLAVVVQMEGRVGYGQTLLVGRVEHVSSGQSVELDDPKVLLRFIEAFVHLSLAPPVQPPGDE